MGSPPTVGSLKIPLLQLNAAGPSGQGQTRFVTFSQSKRKTGNNTRGARPGCPTRARLCLVSTRILG